MGYGVVFLRGANQLQIPEEQGATNTIFFQCALRNQNAEYIYDSEFLFEMLNTDNLQNVTFETITHPALGVGGLLTINDQTIENGIVWVIQKLQSDHTIKTPLEVRFIKPVPVDPNAKAPLEMRMGTLEETLDAIVLDQLVV